MSSRGRTTAPVITEVRFTQADPGLRATGLRGWISCLLDGRYKLAGLTLRRTAQGRFTISFPFRDDGWGKRWHFFHPIDDRTRIELERQVLEQLDLDGEAAR